MIDDGRPWFPVRSVGEKLRPNRSGIRIVEKHIGVHTDRGNLTILGRLV